MLTLGQVVRTLYFTPPNPWNTGALLSWHVFLGITLSVSEVTRMYIVQPAL